MSPDTQLLFKKAQEQIGNRVGAHGWDHALRVRAIALEIAKGQNINEKALEAMALLHDVYRTDSLQGEESLTKTLEIAEKILKECNYSEEETKFILEGIESHSLHSERDKKPASLEAQILFDADKIDATGEMGLARAITIMSKMGIPLDKAAEIYLAKVKEFEEKYHGKLHTENSTRIIAPRIEYSKKFMQEILQQAKIETEGNQKWNNKLSN